MVDTEELRSRIQALNSGIGADLKQVLLDMLGPAQLAAQTPVDADFMTPVWMQNESFPASVDRGLLSALWSGGGVIGSLLSGGGLKVTQRAAGANLSVDIAPGSVVVAGSDAPNQGRYLCRLLAIKNRPLQAVPPAGMQRADLVCATVWDQAVIGATSNPPWNLQIIKGADAASNPAVPAVPASSVALASISPILPATAQITNSMIRDLRPLLPGLGDLASGFMQKIGENTLAAASTLLATFTVPACKGVLVLGKAQVGSGIVDVGYQFNADAGNNYNYVQLYGGSGAPGSSGPTALNMAIAGQVSTVSGAWLSYIPFPSDTALLNKPVITLTGWNDKVALRHAGWAGSGSVIGSLTVVATAALSVGSSVEAYAIL